MVGVNTIWILVKISGSQGPRDLVYNSIINYCISNDNFTHNHPSPTYKLIRTISSASVADKKPTWIPTSHVGTGHFMRKDISLLPKLCSLRTIRAHVPKQRWHFSACWVGLLMLHIPFRSCINTSKIRWMEEILHCLRYTKPYETWDILHINWCRISSINSSSRKLSYNCLTSVS